MLLWIRNSVIQFTEKVCLAIIYINKMPENYLSWHVAKIEVSLKITNDFIQNIIPYVITSVITNTFIVISSHDIIIYYLHILNNYIFSSM